MENMKVALFDIDHTLTSRDTFFLFISYTIKKHPYKIIFLPFLFFVVLLRLFSIIDTTKMKSLSLVLIKEMNLEKLNRFSKQFVDKSVLKYIKNGARDEIMKYKKDGYTIILASASFEFYIKYIAEYFEADYFFGTRIVTKNDRPLAKIDGKNCKRGEKIIRILEVISRDAIDKDNSIGFSDSLVDLHFSEIVGRFYLVDKKRWMIKNFK